MAETKTDAMSQPGYARWVVRMAAIEWLTEHPDNPNAPAVTDALLRTAEDDRGH